MTAISKRVAAIAPSATLAVDAKAKALKAKGEPVIGFGAGEPDFPTPAHIVEAAAEACRDPRNHKYTPTPGLPELREAIAEKTRRDSGYEITPGQAIVTDEIYEHLTFGDHKFHSMPVLVPELADRCVVLNGVAKTYAMTGWRVGWMIGPPDVVSAATNLQSHSTSNVNNVAQRAALAAVAGPLDAVAELRAAF